MCCCRGILLFVVVRSFYFFIPVAARKIPESAKASAKVREIKYSMPESLLASRLSRKPSIKLNISLVCSMSVLIGMWKKHFHFSALLFILGISLYIRTGSSTFTLHSWCQNSITEREINIFVCWMFSLSPNEYINASYSGSSRSVINANQHKTLSLNIRYELVRYSTANDVDIISGYHFYRICLCGSNSNVRRKHGKRQYALSRSPLSWERMSPLYCVRPMRCRGDNVRLA